MGYHGSMSDLATSFNRAVNDLKFEIRYALQNEDSKFTPLVVKEMAERQLAEIRDNLIAQLTVTKEEVLDELAESTNDLPVIEALESEFGSGLESLDEEFATELFAISELGTESEQEVMEQLTFPYLWMLITLLYKELFTYKHQMGLTLT